MLPADGTQILIQKLLLTKTRRGEGDEAIILRVSRNNGEIPCKPSMMNWNGIQKFMQGFYRGRMIARER